MRNPRFFLKVPLLATLNSAMEKLKRIVCREFLNKIQNRSYVVLTFLSPALILGTLFLMFYLSRVNQKGVREILLVDASSLSVKDAFLNTATETYTDLSMLGLEPAKELVRKNKYHGLLYLPSALGGGGPLTDSIVYFSKEMPGIFLLNSMENHISDRLKSHRLGLLGLNAESIAAAEVEVVINPVSFSGSTSLKSFRLMQLSQGMVAGYLVMIFILIYGTSVMRSVVEEKTNRIVELIVASVKPFELMLGKIIGNAMAGLLQFFAWGALLLIFGSFLVPFIETNALASASLSSTGDGFGNLNDFIQVLQWMPELPWFQLFVMFVFYFLGGFFFYSSIFAAIGAAVDRETDTQQFLLPVLLPLTVAVYVGMLSVMSDPHGSLATVLSMVPFTSPVVMLMRLPFGVPQQELMISLALLLLGFLFVVWAGAKIYRIGILMQGKKVTYKELFKWIWQ